MRVQAEGIEAEMGNLFYLALIDCIKEDTKIKVVNKAEKK